MDIVCSAFILPWKSQFQSHIYLEWFPSITSLAPLGAGQQLPNCSTGITGVMSSRRFSRAAWGRSLSVPGFSELDSKFNLPMSCVSALTSSSSPSWQLMVSDSCQHFPCGWRLLWPFHWAKALTMSIKMYMMLILWKWCKHCKDTIGEHYFTSTKYLSILIICFDYYVIETFQFQGSQSASSVD